jgi:hypothetical protein
MKSEYLSEIQLEQVSKILNKYGIESHDLLEELTDHYARKIEEEIEEGKTFDEAYEEFVSQNSWLKLRKLQHAHWKYSEKSLFQFMLRSLQELYSIPKVLIPVLIGTTLFYLLKAYNHWAQTTLLVLHVALIIQTLYIFVIAISKSRKYKMLDVGYVAQTSVTVFYALILPTWSDSWSLSTPLISSELGIAIQWGYYFLVAHLGYLHMMVFKRGLAKINQREILG